MGSVRETGRVTRGTAAAWLLLCAPLLMPHAALAQSIPGRTIVDGTGTSGQGKSRGEINQKPQRDYEALTLGDWLFYPSLNVGYVYNDNITAARFNKISSSGLRLQPTFVARRNAGIHDTTVYGSADLQFYDRSDWNQFTGYGGVTHVWEIRRDLIARFQGEYGRFVSLTSTGLGPASTKPIYYDQGYLSTSLTKSFDRFFVSGGGSLTNVNYTSRGYTDGTTYSVMSRLGYRISPVFFAYLEPTYNWVRNANSLGDSSGYSVVGGLGSDRIGLFTFNAYAGYNAQSYSDSRLGDFSGPTFGGSVTWEALRQLRFTATASHSLGLAGGQVVGPNYSSIVSRSSGTLSANYEFTRQLSATASATYDHESYSGINRTDNITTASASLNYMFTRYLGVNTSYTFSKVNSNLPGASYSQNVFTVGGRTQF